MGLRYLWDTNAVAYYLQKNFSQETLIWINDNVIHYQVAMSSITQIELLSWKINDLNDIKVLNDFISDSVIFELEPSIKLKTVELRRTYSIKLPDAIIAATALMMDLTLISNDRGFSKIASLKLFNPFKSKIDLSDLT
jgi:predicted nucleic acid-binding protein